LNRSLGGFAAHGIDFTIALRGHIESHLVGVIATTHGGNSVKGKGMVVRLLGNQTFAFGSLCKIRRRAKGYDAFHCWQEGVECIIGWPTRHVSPWRLRTFLSHSRPIGVLVA
jgi:hypothetical protein